MGPPTPRKASVPAAALLGTVPESCDTTQEHEFFVVVLFVISWLIIIISFPFSLFLCLKVCKEYERIVILRLGKLLPGGARGPGIYFTFPCIDVHHKVDLRVISFDVPPQEILSKDSVTVSVDAVVYFRICNPIVSVTVVNDLFQSTKLLAQTTLRNVLGTKSLSEMLMQREEISTFMEKVLDEATDPWGVKVERVEVKDIRLPHQLMRAMAAEAEAAREARARIINADGEKQASFALREAADVVANSPGALQLRYLQTLNSIAAEHNSTIVFPLPIDLFKCFLGGTSSPPRRKTSDVASPSRLSVLRGVHSKRSEREKARGFNTTNNKDVSNICKTSSSIELGTRGEDSI